MNLTELQYMLALEELGNITRVAERFYVSPSAISQCLKKEREEQGIPLFRYEERHMVPTEAGRVYLDTARKLVQIHDETYQKIGAASEKGADEIRIACSPVFEDDFEKKILPEIRRQLPKTNLTVLPLNAVNALEYMSNSMAEMALLPVPSEWHTTMLEEDVLGENHLQLIVPRAYLHLPEGKTPGVEDCETIPFILLSRNSLMRTYEDKVLVQHHISSSRIYEVSNYLSCREFLESGRGATFLPVGFLPEESAGHFYRIEPTPKLAFRNLLLTSSIKKPDAVQQKVKRMIEELWKDL